MLWCWLMGVSKDDKTMQKMFKTYMPPSNHAHIDLARRDVFQFERSETQCYMDNEKCLEQYTILCTIIHHHCGTQHGSMSMKIVLQHTKCTCGIFHSWYKLCQNGRVDKKGTFTHDDTVGTVTWYKNVTF